MSLKKDIQFSLGERSAIAIIVVLLMLSYAYNYLAKPTLIYNQQTLSFDEILKEKEVVEIKQIEQKSNALISNRRAKKKLYYYPPPKYETFNPNLIDSLKWIQLGVKPWTVSTIIKYRSKGGKFYKCADLSKVYNLPDSIFQKLKPYCNVPKEKRKTSKKYPQFKKSTKEKFRNKPKDSSYTYTEKKTKSYKPIIIDINDSDTAALSRLYGIGTILSQRIIKYRTALGGFHSISQLSEVYGIEQEVIDNNLDKLTLKGSIRKLSINSPADSLAKHPYLDWRISKVIVNYRKQHGDFQNLNDLKNIRLVSDSMFNRLIPYLSLE